MTNVDESVVARLKKAGHTFEILVDCDKALAFRHEGGDLSEVLTTKDIFSDVKKGERANEKDLQEAFSSDDVSTIAEEIIKKGEIQLTAAHREKMREQTHKQLVNLIHQNAIDSKTGYPHPPQRIESALEESGFRLDEHKRAEDQMEDALKKLRSIIPIKFEKRELELTIPPAHVGAARGIIHQHKVTREDWLTDGSYCVVVEIPSGIMDELLDKLNSISRGSLGSKILKTIE